MILLTGTPGWLGNRFAEILSKKEILNKKFPDLIKKEKIRCLCLPGTDISFLETLSKNIEIVYGDITRIESLDTFFQGAKGATLFHIAGVIHPKRVKDFYRINLEGAKNILDKAKEYEVKKTVVMSSNSQSGCNPYNEHRFTEDSPYNPYMNYGKSKYKMELLVKNYIKNFDMDITIVRSCWFFGPHQPDRQTTFFTMIKNGKFPIVGNGENKRSLSYVDDICQGMLLAAKNPISKGETYWIANEKAYSMNEIVEIVGKVLKDEFNFEVKRNKFKLPSLASKVAYLVDNIFQGAGLYNKEFHVLSEMNKNISCSIDKAKIELGYKPSVDLYEGMKRSVKWCLEKGIEL